MKNLGSSLAPLVLAMTIPVHLMMAATVVVGPAGCHQGSPHFSTVQAAVNAAPGGNVLVCPGTYKEQVVITTPLVLKGVSYNGSSAAIIAVPSGGLVANSVLYQSSLWWQYPPIIPLTAQLLVQNTHDVAISNLVIDGGGLSACGGTPVPAIPTAAGIAIVNSGQASHPVSVSNTIVRNSCGSGILSDVSLSILQSNDVYNTGGDSIDVVGDSLPSEVKGNTVAPLTNRASAMVAIHLVGLCNFVTPTVVNGNTFNGQMLADDYCQAKISGNVVEGVTLQQSSSNYVTSNTITGLIYICGYLSCGNQSSDYPPGANGNVISNNTVSVSPAWIYYGQSYLIGYSCGGGNLIQSNVVAGGGISMNDTAGGFCNYGSNTVRYNTIQGTKCGIATNGQLNSTFYGNTLIGVTSNTC